MNPFFAAIQRYINDNAGAVVVLFFSVVIGVFIISQTITRTEIENKNDHARFTAELTKNAADIVAVNARFEDFRDEMRVKMEKMGNDISRILAILEKQ